MSPDIIKQEVRVLYETRPTTLRERALQWWRFVWFAITSMPETEKRVAVQIKPDDPRWHTCQHEIIRHTYSMKQIAEATRENPLRKLT